MGDNFGPLNDAVMYRGLSPLTLVNSVDAPIAESSNGRACLISLCSVVIAHTVMHCIVAPGVGVNYAWGVRIGGQFSNVAPNVTSYSPPLFERVFGEGAFGSPTEGGPKVCVCVCVCVSPLSSCAPVSSSDDGCGCS
jgi:hypothetical protein